VRGSETPPPGRARTFPEWSAAITAGVRFYLAEACAARRGARHVIVRHGDREAHLEDDRAAFCISFCAGDMHATHVRARRSRPARRLHREESLEGVAGFFDARFTLPD
jgi:hypothetical protein